MFVHSFGSCFIECIEQIVSDRDVLLDSRFAKILEKAAKDWCSIAIELNGGNDTRHNISKMGSRIIEIENRCEYLFETVDRDKMKRTDWERILSDVKWVTKAIVYEILHNFEVKSPEEKEYKKMPRTEY